jgi:6-phosphogluconolactonase
MALLTIVQPDVLTHTAAERLTTLIASAITERGAAFVSLTGGSTPRPVYEALADDARPWRSEIDWARVHLYWGDERCVPPDHPDSNFGMANRALIRHVPVPPGQIHRMRGEIDPHEAAREYERVLPETFDVMLLGIGEDAHIASMFPRPASPRPALKAGPPDPAGPDQRGRADLQGRPVAAVYAEHLNSWRITLTPSALLNARRIVMLVEGEKKADAVEAAIEEPLDVERYPAQLVREADARVEWIMDAAAASRLRGVPPA